MPKRAGCIGKIEGFDAYFFKVSNHEANAMDPQLRLLAEVTAECIMDSGENKLLINRK